MNLRKHDLNLIPILDALLRHRNVTRAGEEVGLSQSATSHALTRLRDIYDDPLLVPSGREMLLSRKGELLLDTLRVSVQSIEQLFEAQDFDPSKSRRHFCISTSDYVGILFLPELIRRLRSQAPNVTVQMIWDVNEAAARLRAGKLDLAVLPANSINADDIVHETLYEDDLVIVAAKDNPAFDRTVDLQTVSNGPLIVFRREQSLSRGFAEIQLTTNGISLDGALFVPDFVMIPFIVAETNYLALLHRRFTVRMQKLLAIKLAKPPFPVANFALNAFWSTNSERDPAHRWFRSLLREVVASV